MSIKETAGLIVFSGPKSTPYLTVALAGLMLSYVPSDALAVTPSKQPAYKNEATHVADQILKNLMEINGVPGMSAAVWKDGKIVWNGNSGVRDLQSKALVDASTTFRLASVSKVMAAVAAAKLHEQGRLDVDAPIQTYLKDLNPAWPAISPRQLSSHSAGIPHYQTVDANRGGVHFKTVTDSLKVFSERDLIFSPGKQYGYSSYGYTLLTAVIEAKSGKPYLDYLQSDVVPGLQIGPDQTNAENSKAANVSKAYIFGGNGIEEAAPHDYSYSWGGAGLAATATDLARFGGRLLDGGIVSNKTVDWMGEPTKLNDASDVREPEYSVGFGFRRSQDSQGQTYLHHSGVTQGARSALIFYPQHKVAISVLSNALWVSSIERTALTLSAAFRHDHSKNKSTPCPINTKMYRGIYADKPISGTVKFTSEAGLCTATLSSNNAFGEWIERVASNKRWTTLRLVSFGPNGGLADAALVTPIGAYEMQQQADGSYKIVLSATTALSLRF